jgi:predicted DNA-binding transcriptional regulator YafY
LKVNRLFEILYLLIDRKNITARELAEHFEISVRTVYRDIECLSQAGIPVYMSKGKGGGISILPGYTIDKAVLTDEEKSQILASLRAVSSVDPDGTGILDKLGLLFGKANNNWIEIDFSSWKNGYFEKDVFETLKSAVIERKALSFRYFNGKGESSLRKVYPLKLCFKGQGWYLYAYCCIKEDYRFFKLNRIKDLSVLSESFDLTPPETIFHPAESLTLPCITLKLKLSPQAAYRVFDEFDNAQEDPDGYFTVSIEMPEGEWIYGYILSFGESCEVLEPQHIREEVARRIRVLNKKYL